MFPKLIGETLTFNWRQLWMCMHVLKKVDVIVDDLLLSICIDWVICSCIHKCWIRCISILTTTNTMYSYWRRPYIYIHISDDRILYIHIGDENDTNVSWGDILGDDLVPHACKVASMCIA